MDIDQARAYFLEKKGAVEKRPFGPEVPVFKVGGKMFALINSHENRPSINLKHAKDNNEMLRSAYEEIIPGYHMNKSWWNTVYLDGALPDALICDLIDASYDLVLNSLTKTKQKEVLSG